LVEVLKDVAEHELAVMELLIDIQWNSFWVICQLFKVNI
jgi:hypothetical protein